MGPIQELALNIDVGERTLRRAASQGTLRARRIGPRRLRLEAGERDYLRAHWQLLSSLRKALRTRRDVRLAVLYGSMARGDEDAGSDLDLLISSPGEAVPVRSDLAASLQCVTGRRVDIAHLSPVEASAPLLLDRILDDGRVLVDRDGVWGALRDRRRAIAARAQRAHHRQLVAASLAIKELTQ